MNAAAPGLRAPARAGTRLFGTLSAWRRAIASLGPTPWKWAALIAVFGIVLECALTFAELQPSVPLRTMAQLAATSAICWSLDVSLCLCAWAIADRVDAPPSSRPRRLAVSLVAAILLESAIGPALVDHLVGRLDPCLLHECKGKDWSKVPGWLRDTEQSGQTLIFGALLFAWLEMQRRNREIEARLVTSQQERARLQRATFETRLTAMQAQVDPQFLFDCLADVQADYERDAMGGAAALDRLITYLRAALPRLRSAGSTIGTEAELVRAWLDVIAMRRGGRPLASIEVAPDCANVPFSATVLLPLVQWVLDGLDDPPATLSLAVRRAHRTDGDRILAQLRVAPARTMHLDEPDALRLRERLQTLYGEAAQLSCHVLPDPDRAAGSGPAAQPAAAIITLIWPDESTDRDRR